MGRYELSQKRINATGGGGGGDEEEEEEDGEEEGLTNPLVRYASQPAIGEPWSATGEWGP